MSDVPRHREGWQRPGSTGIAGWAHAERVPAGLWMRSPRAAHSRPGHAGGEGAGTPDLSFHVVRSNGFQFFCFSKRWHDVLICDSQ